MKVLLLTNDKDYTEIISTFIRLFLRAEPEVANSPDAAEITIGKNPPDILIADLDGGQREFTLELIARLRGDRQTKRLPVIGISHDEACRDRALGAGASSFLRKPFKVEDLETRIQNLLRET